MKDLSRVDTLCRIKLRYPFVGIVEELGPADETSISPRKPDGSGLVIYLWRRRSPAIAVLTLRTESGEYVCGIRASGSGTIGSDLGFDLGSSRAAVVARCGSTAKLEDNVLEMPLEDGTLTVRFAADVVWEIQVFTGIEFEADEVE